MTRKHEFQQALYEFRPDVILPDHSLPEFNSIGAMQIWKEYQTATNIMVPFILVTGSVSEEFAVQIIKAGADDYILKDRLRRLPASIRNALEKVRLENESRKFMSEGLSMSALMKGAEHLASFGTGR
ncbi:MAG TPA: response regulator [Chryseosolibacter sp.]